MMYKKESTVRRRLGAVVLLPAMALGCVVINLPAVAGVLDETAGGKIIPVSAGKVNKIPENQEIKIPASEIGEMGAESVAEISNEPKESVQNIEVSEKEKAKSYDKEELIAFIADTNKKLSGADEDKKGNVCVAVETLAEFPGGHAALMKWLATNIRYPEEAHKAKIQGKVVVKFVVESDGKIGDITVLRSVSPELDAESIRVVKSMPKWVPAKVGDKDVASYYSLPISFRLTDDETAKTIVDGPANNEKAKNGSLKESDKSE